MKDKKVTCPECGKNNMVKKNGSFIAKQKSSELVEIDEPYKQRYYCKECGKSFIDRSAPQMVGKKLLCPACGSKAIKKNGKYEKKLKCIKKQVKMQKYYCSKCKKSFVRPYST